MNDPANIVVPYDFSVHSRAALSAAKDLGTRLGADLHLVHVVHRPVYAYRVCATDVAPPFIDMKEIGELVRKTLLEIADRCSYARGRIEAHVVEGDGVAEAIRDSAESLGADLITMGTHGRTGLVRAVLGSVAEKTLRSAPCPVVTVHAPGGEEESTA